MKTRRILRMTKWIAALVLVLAVVPWVGISGPTITLDKQLLLDTPPRADDPPKPRIPPYEEKARIQIPETFGAGQECYAAAYEASTDDDREYFDTAALLCFSCNKGKLARTCSEARSETWPYQSVVRLETVPIFHDRDPRQGVLFIAGPVSGWDKFITLWAYVKECGQFVNVLPGIPINRSHEFKFLSDPKRKHDGVLVVAEYAPAEGETREDDPSAYWIKMYRYRNKKKEFEPIVGGEFLTEKKYFFNLEGADTTKVIDDHMDKIRRVLDQTGSQRSIPRKEGVSPSNATSR